VYSFALPDFRLSRTCHLSQVIAPDTRSAHHNARVNHELITSRAITHASADDSLRIISLKADYFDLCGHMS
jgi:hypothetical protein